MNKYVLNKTSYTLHILNGCCHSKEKAVKNLKNAYELFRTEDEAISKHQNHMKYCKICFKGR